MTNIEAVAVLEDMKVKINIPRAAETQRKRNEALEKAIQAIVHCEHMDAIWDGVCKKISIPTPSEYADCILQKVVIEEMQDPGYTPPTQRTTFTQTDFDPFAVCKFDAGREKK